MTSRISSLLKFNYDLPISKFESRITYVFWEVVGTLVATFREIYAMGFFFTYNYPFGLIQPVTYYGLNPRELTDEQLELEPILFLHAIAHNESGAFPLAEQLEIARAQGKKLGPIFSVKLDYSNDNPKPHLDALLAKVNAIAKMYIDKGRTCRLNIVGHSMGGIVAVDLMRLLTEEKLEGYVSDKNFQINKIIAIASRLKFVTASWPRNGDPALKTIVDRVHAFILKTPKLALYSLVPTRDWLVPMESSSIGLEGFLLENYSHTSAALSPEGLNKTIEILLRKINILI